MASIDATGKGRDRLYRVRYRTRSGESRSRSFKRQEHAKTFASTVETDKSRGAFANPARARIRFETWEQRWRDAPRPGRASSRARDESYLRSLVVPHFGKYRLGDVTRSEVQGWVDKLASEPRDGTDELLAPATVHKAHQVLAKVLEAAVIDERLATNPPRGVRLPRVEDGEARFLTADELLALEEAMPEPWGLLVPFLADVGLRIGEAAGLRWSDVDTWAGTVQVRQVLVEVHGRITLGPPKTAAGRRSVPTLTREVGKRLEAQHAGARAATCSQRRAAVPSGPTISEPGRGVPPSLPRSSPSRRRRHTRCATRRLLTGSRRGSSRTSWRSGPAIGRSRRSTACTGTCSTRTLPRSAKPSPRSVPRPLRSAPTGVGF